MYARRRTKIDRRRASRSSCVCVCVPCVCSCLVTSRACQLHSINLSLARTRRDFSARQCRPEATARSSAAATVRTRVFSCFRQRADCTGEEETNEHAAIIRGRPSRVRENQIVSNLVRFSSIVLHRQNTIRKLIMKCKQNMLNLHVTQLQPLQSKRS